MHKPKCFVLNMQHWVIPALQPLPFLGVYRTEKDRPCWVLHQSSCNVKLLQQHHVCAKVLADSAAPDLDACRSAPVQCFARTMLA